ncbi:MAG: helix-turn-helix transcriptional regulator [Clostridia bacterium]|nr:helix-turn-helix transcriptional regulator [Clostridia bacterium]
MNQIKIGKFIAQCRNENNLTQEALGEKLGVTNKTISRWENGHYLPDIEMLQLLSKEFNISINELITGERIKDIDYKEKAEENLIKALENSSFSLKEKIDFYKNKWKKEHFFELTIEMLLILLIIGVGFYFNNEFVLLGAILGFIYCRVNYKRIMAYIENHVCRKFEDK